MDSGTSSAGDALKSSPTALATPAPTAPLAVFVSPHGFGHAARASAVMRALAPHVTEPFQLFATTPRWFFDEAVAGRYVLHQVETDVGFRQRDALAFDLDGTVRALDRFLPFDPALVEALSAKVSAARCGAVLCDISPLGVAVAERAGVPSILVENFIWPWLYEPLLTEAPGLAAHAATLERWFSRATVHIQATPFCEPTPAAAPVPPVCRPVCRSREEVRRELSIPLDAPTVVLTMGGVDQALPFLGRLPGLAPVHFIVTGAPATRSEGTVRAFDRDTRLYMPDLVGAADAVVAKLGYSTLAEVWSAGKPLARITRDDFREMPALDAWAERNVPGFAVPAADFAGGGWLERVDELLALAPVGRGSGSVVPLGWTPASGLDEPLGPGPVPASDGPAGRSSTSDGPTGAEAVAEIVLRTLRRPPRTESA